jgi:hypothetical protein
MTYWRWDPESTENFGFVQGRWTTVFAPLESGTLDLI